MATKKKSRGPASADDKRATTSGPPTPKRRSGLRTRPTIKDVAEAAGVSVATVSFVLNNSPGQVISEPVKKRVLEITQKLGYHPSAAAAGLARQRTRNVALVFYLNDHLITNLLYSFVVQGAIKEAAERGYNVLFSFIDTEYTSQANLPLVVRERSTEGALFIQSVTESLVNDIQDRGVACVAVDNHPMIAGLESIGMDNRMGAELVVGHLADLGHTNIGFLRAGIDRPSIAERSQGFRDALKARGLPFNARSNLFDGKELSFQVGYSRALAVLKAHPELTALFCANDEMAAGAVRAARELGIAVPKRLSIVGFDDVTMSNYIDPPLTTVGFDKEGMGRLAMARLLARVEGSRDAGVDVSARHLIPVELVVRESTARAPR